MRQIFLGSWALGPHKGRNDGLQNLWWAAGYNAAAIPVAAGALAWAGVDLPPAVGAILMSASTIVVALNAQLLRRVDLRPAAASTSRGAGSGPS